MAMTTCSECSGEVSTKARACPKCGAIVPSRKAWLWIGLVAVVVVAALFATLPSGYEAWRERQLTSLVRASLKDPESARFEEVHVRPSGGCGWVNAKNAMGGYVGSSRFVVTSGKVSFDPGEVGKTDPKERIAELEARLAFLNLYESVCPDQAAEEGLG